MSDAQVEIEKLGSSEDSGSQRAEIFERPTGWRGYYHHPVTQVSMLGLVCFMCPGMFNALSGLGGGGQVNTKDQANANATLNATFAFFAFFSGYVRPSLPLLPILTIVIVVRLITCLVLDGPCCLPPGATRCISLPSCKVL
jgi:hypothetical protein